MALLVSGLACTAAQYSSGKRVSDPPATADAHRASDRISREARLAREGVPVIQKHPRLAPGADVEKALGLVQWRWCPYPRCGAAGEGPVCAARFVSAPTHSLPRQPCVARNLITVFSTVNTCPEKNPGAAGACSARARASCNAYACASCKRMAARAKHRDRKPHESRHFLQSRCDSSVRRVQAALLLPPGEDLATRPTAT